MPLKVYLIDQGSRKFLLSKAFNHSVLFSPDQSQVLHWMYSLLKDGNRLQLFRLDFESQNNEKSIFRNQKLQGYNLIYDHWCGGDWLT